MGYEILHQKRRKAVVLSSMDVLNSDKRHSNMRDTAIQPNGKFIDENDVIVIKF
jgi:hypothetical protein